MYTKPTLERYGTFRELTQVGFQGASDGVTFNGAGGPATGNGCTQDPNTGQICCPAARS